MTFLTRPDESIRACVPEDPERLHEFLEMIAVCYYERRREPTLLLQRPLGVYPSPG